MQRLRTVTSLDVSAVAGHHAMPAALLLNTALLNKAENMCHWTCIQCFTSNAYFCNNPPFSYIKNGPYFYFYISADHIKVHYLS